MGTYKRKACEWLLPGEVDEVLPAPIRRCDAMSREQADDVLRKRMLAARVEEEHSDDSNEAYYGDYVQWWNDRWAEHREEYPM